MECPTPLVGYEVAIHGCPRVDQHVHTTYSDGIDTPAACVSFALERGLTEIAFADHVWRKSAWVSRYADEVKALRDRVRRLGICIGLEAKAVDLNGNVDVTPQAASEVDFVMGVVHRYQPDNGGDLARLAPRAAAELETLIVLRMLENPLVNVIGHPTRTYYRFFYPDRTRAPFPSDMIAEIAQAASARGKHIEYNTQIPLAERILDALVGQNVEFKFTLGSDAHQASAIGRIDFESISAAARRASKLATDSQISSQERDA